MRRRRPLAFAGFLVVVLGAVIGFASFTARRPEPSAAENRIDIDLPGDFSGRVSAAILDSKLTPAADPPTTTTSPVAPGPEPAADASTGAALAPATTAAPTTTTTTTTTPPTTTTTTTTTTTLPPITFRPSVEQWRPLVATYFPANRVDEALSVMECESGGDPSARNLTSTASGLYQFLGATWNWASASAGVGGVSVFDPEANVATAAFLVESSIDRGLPAWQHWVCQPDL